MTREEFSDLARDLLVTQGEWAAMARVPVATVKQWKQRTDLYPDFPKPLIGLPRARSPLYWRPDVEAWMQAYDLPGGTTRPDARERLARR